MKVLIVSQWFQPEPTFKGLPFAQALVARKHTVEVLTGFPNYPGGKLYPGYRVRLWQRETMDGVRVNRVALYPNHDQSGLRRMFNYLSFALSSMLIGPWLVSKPDVIYVYNLVTLGPAAFLLRRLFGAKVILDVQDLWPESVINSGMLNNHTLLRWLSAICIGVYRRADWLTVLSPGFKQALVERGVDEDKIEVIHNWCDETAQKPAPRDEALAQELGFKDHFNILFAGTIGVVQGMDTVLDAAQICHDRVPDAQFVFIGGGVERSRLETRAAEMGLINVLFLPQQTPEAMGRFYALADALLVHLKDDPLFRITIPSKTQTYLYMGKPIIMALEGDAADLVRQAGAGLLCPSQDPVALAETVAKLAALTTEQREWMGQSGAEYYAQNLSMAAGVARFERRMQRLTGL
ncbi:MAG TPA: glycosyltransferase family 4 protein [Anaerolineae bacterium]|nr:glycosyltransferase family 4 protein [Anaerolineae bacterium]